MTKKKRNLLVTLADRNYINQAKQLFSSVYHNAGWQGDYMLLAHQIPEKDLKWFKDKGILIYKCKPLTKEDIGSYPKTVLDKLYLFTPYFKQWNHVVFLDADIIVRASLDKLTKVKGFAAVKDIGDYKISVNISNKNKITYNKIIKSLDVEKTGFNSGVFAFNTNLIKNKTKSEMIKMFNKYKQVLTSDQPLLNLYFKKVVFLPRIYNIYILSGSKVYKEIAKHAFKGVFHFASIHKPWLNSSLMHKEWNENLAKADRINLKVRPSIQKLLSQKDIKEYESFYNKIKKDLGLTLELSNLYQTDKKKFRDKIRQEIIKNPSIFNKEICYYYLLSMIPSSIKSKIKKYKAK